MMKQNKMQNERINQRKLVNPTKKEWRWHVAQFGVGCLLLFFAVNVPVLAAGNVDTSQITNGFDAIYQVIAAIVSAIGSIFLLWGLFEWAQSLNTQDGGAQSIAFKRIGRRRNFVFEAAWTEEILQNEKENIRGSLYSCFHSGTDWEGMETISLSKATQNKSLPKS